MFNGSYRSINVKGIFIDYWLDYNWMVIINGYIIYFDGMSFLLIDIGVKYRLVYRIFVWVY